MITEYVNNKKQFLLDEIKKIKEPLKLLIVQINNDPASNAYIRGKLKDLAEIGAIGELLKLDINITMEELKKVIDKLNNDINSAYDVLSNSMKEKYVSLDNFRMYINNNLNRITTDADKCSLENVKNKRIYTVLDKNSNKYVFVETNIMNYKVDFYLYDNSVENK